MTLQWNPTLPAIAIAIDALWPLAYVLELGSTVGGSQLGSFALGRVTTLTALAPPGQYLRPDPARRRVRSRAGVERHRRPSAVTATRTAAALVLTLAGSEAWAGQSLGELAAAEAARRRAIVACRRR